MAMQFGHFLYYSNLDPSRDAEVIDEALAESRLAEELGYDVLWFGEGHFLGSMVYADPVVFAAAVAMQTKTIKLGFAVLTLGIYQPVRLAVQLALLDNLSKGRLIVGEAASGLGAQYTYAGFGVDPEIARGQLDEFEDLMVQAWTTENLHFQGKYFNVTIPAIRPTTYQKPHPPLFRGCISTESTREMGKRGRPILLISGSSELLREQLDVYTGAMREAGFGEEVVQQNLDKLWLAREVYVADTNQQAIDEFVTGNLKRRETMKRLRAALPLEQGPLAPDRPTRVQQTTSEFRLSNGETASVTSNMGSIFGSPEYVKEQIAELRDMGIKNLMMTHYGGAVTPQQQAASMRLLSEKVMPAFRESPASAGVNV